MRPWLPVTTLCMALVVATTVWAQDGVDAPPKRFEIWDLDLGAPVSQLPDEFVDYACGTGGGVPSLAIAGWTDFRRCRPEASGLREVFFRYDDELEYWARANDLLAELEQYAGTRAYGFPVFASALIDEGGILQGIRLVSDPRDGENRQEAYFLKNYLTARFGREGWACEDLPVENGETAVDGVLIKQVCAKSLEDGRQARMSVRHLRKSGQAAVDPRTGRQTRGQFESLVRFELLRAGN